MEDEKVFIVGCPRTGSTLLRKILNKSEKICIIPETHFLRWWSVIGHRKKIVQFGDLENDENVDNMINYLYSEHMASTRGYWRWLNNNVDKGVFREKVLRSDRSERSFFILLMQVYAENTLGVITNGLIQGEKTPAHIYYVPTLLEWYPKAKIIHTLRDPRGIFVSASKLVGSGKWSMKERSLPLPDWAPVRFRSFVEMLHISKLWFDAVSLHQRYMQLYSQSYCLVKFEDLISEPEKQIQNICNFLELPFERKMLEEVRIVGSSFSTQGVSHRGFDQKATERWKEHINPLARAWFSILGRKHLQKFGYSP